MAASTSLCPMPSAADAKIGVEALDINGTHFETHGSVSAHLTAPVLHLSVGNRRVEFQAEGVPVFGFTSGTTPGSGSTTTDLGFVDGSFRGAIDPKARIWFGLGGIAINQQTQSHGITDPFFFATRSSRVSGVRYETQLKLPIKNDALIFGFADMPNLNGTVFFRDCKYCVPTQLSEQEIGTMTDISTMFEARRGHSTVDFGVRFINFAAVYASTHTLADRDVGGGLTIRYSYSIAH